MTFPLTMNVLNDHIGDSSYQSQAFAFDDAAASYPNDRLARCDIDANGPCLVVRYRDLGIGSVTPVVGVDGELTS